MADFRVKSVIFHALDWLPRLPQARSQRPHYSRMAELLMNSAIPSEGSMRTSWPALRNGYWATQTGYHSESTGRRCGRLSKSKLEPAVGNRNQSIAKLNMLNGAAKAQSAIR